MTLSVVSPVIEIDASYTVPFVSVPSIYGRLPSVVYINDTPSDGEDVIVAFVFPQKAPPAGVITGVIPEAYRG
jgi:hypothetical protein